MSKTLRAPLSFALPIAVAAPLALGGCHGIQDINPSNPDPTVVDPAPGPVGEGVVYSADKAPPAISGGTLVALKDGVTAVAADPDRDRIWVVDTAKLAVKGSIALEADDEPGRGVEDGAGRVWVALRRGGAVVVVDVDGAKVASRIPVCAEPRGIAYDPAADQIHVACVGGELVTLAATTLTEVRRLRLDRDLRDVLVNGTGLRVSRFRSAELLSVDATGAVVLRAKPPASTNTSGLEFDPAVAWRTIALPSGGVAVLHQRGLSSPVPAVANAYYVDPCAVIVQTQVTVADPGAPTQTPGAGGLFVSLAVDMAIAPDGQSVAVAAAGDRVVVETTLGALEQVDTANDCAGGALGTTGAKHTPMPGTPIAVAYDGESHLLVQNREPASVWVFGRGEIALPAESRRDSGHELFHSAPSGGIACASCHPEGREDGRVWKFEETGDRRTQSVAGGVLDSGHLHWAGDLPNFDALISEVLVSRMQHAQPGPLHARAFATWLDALPAPKASPAADASAVAKGSALFHDATVGCATCHAGPKLTTGATATVGTGEAFKIPSLVGVAARAPFMHNGCAATLVDRFGSCGGSRHGSTAALTPDQLGDLVAFMETL